MVRRNKRHRGLFSADAERLENELTQLHGLMMGMQRKLVPGTTHHLAIERLSDAIIATIRVTTGREPSWMRLAESGRMTGQSPAGGSGSQPGLLGSPDKELTP